MNASTTRLPTTAATRADRGSSVPAAAPLAAPAAAPFAALPHDIAGDPRLSPTDVRVLLALLYWARSKAACWPSDTSIGLRVGRSVSTVQRALRRLQALGLIDRQPDAGNRTGRRVLLRWRPTPVAPMTDLPASSVTDEGIREREKERPESAAGYESPPPPAGDEGTEPDLAMLHQWAEGPDPILRRIAGRRLAELAAEAEAAVENATPSPDLAPARPPAVAPRPTGSTGCAADCSHGEGLPKAGDASAGLRTIAPAVPRRRANGPRPGPNRPGRSPLAWTLAAWMTRRSP